MLFNIGEDTVKFIFKFYDDFFRATDFYFVTAGNNFQLRKMRSNLFRNVLLGP